MAGYRRFKFKAGRSNGATEVFIALFGEQGWHARTAVGVSGLPGNASVEVDVVVRLKS